LLLESYDRQDIVFVPLVPLYGECLKNKSKINILVLILLRGRYERVPFNKMLERGLTNFYILCKFGMNSTRN
jgi:hypothetical protein